MISKLSKIFFILTLGIAFSNCAQSTDKSVTAKEKKVLLISPEELQARIDTIVLIDVRTPQEYNSGHLKNAVNIDYFDADFVNKVNKLDKNKDVYIYCKSGNRSGKAADKLEKSGFIKVYDLQGGITNWNKKNLEIIN